MDVVIDLTVPESNAVQIWNAVENEKVEELTALLEKVDLEDLKFEQKYEKYLDHQYTALMVASHKGYTGLADKLIQAGAVLDQTSSDWGKTALMCACREGQIATMRALMLLEADPNVQDKDGWTALMLAASRGQADIVKELAQLGANISIQNHKIGMSALMWAAKHNHITTLQTLVHLGADVNEQNTLGWTALMIAVEDGHFAAVQALVDLGADIDWLNLDGKNALMRSAESGRTSTVQRLVQLGAKVNMLSITGLSAVVSAALNNHSATVTALVSLGADLSLMDNHGCTVLMLAALADNAAMVRLLLTLGADINALNYNGSTALMLAVWNGKTATVLTLLKAGANRSIVNYNGLTAADLAKTEALNQLISSYVSSAPCVVPVIPTVCTIPSGVHTTVLAQAAPEPLAPSAPSWEAFQDTTINTFADSVADSFEDFGDFVSANTVEVSSEQSEQESINDPVPLSPADRAALDCAELQSKCDAFVVRTVLTFGKTFLLEQFASSTDPDAATEFVAVLKRVSHVAVDADPDRAAPAQAQVDELACVRLSLIAQVALKRSQCMADEQHSAVGCLEAQLALLRSLDPFAWPHACEHDPVFVEQPCEPNLMTSVPTLEGSPMSASPPPPAQPFESPECAASVSNPPSPTLPGSVPDATGSEQEEPYSGQDISPATTSPDTSTTTAAKARRSLRELSVVEVGNLMVQYELDSLQPIFAANKVKGRRLAQCELYGDLMEEGLGVPSKAMAKELMELILEWNEAGVLIP